jgi:hypothetical protein
LTIHFEIRPLVIFVTMIIAFITKSSAQNNDSRSFQYFGFQAGVNISNMNFNAGEPPPSITSESAWKTGLTFGIQLRIPIFKKILVQPEYSFCERNGSDKSLAINYSMDYFSLPLLIVYQLTPRISLLGGPQFEILIDARSYENGNSNNITHDMEERGIGIMGGLEFSLFRSIFLSTRYLQGLNHVGLRNGPITKEYKYQSVMLSAGIKF